MITKEIIKSEIDNIEDEYLEVLFRIVKALEVSKKLPKNNFKKKKSLSWHKFIEATYGCLADDPIRRGEQGDYEIRQGFV